MFRLVSVAWLGLLAAACSGDTTPATGNADASSGCVPDMVPTCVLERAAVALAEVEPGADWVAGAAELAVAYDEIGEPSRALLLLEQAVSQASALTPDKERTNALSSIATAVAGLRPNQGAVSLLARIEASASGISEADPRWDLLGKVIGAEALHGDFAEAEQKARAMPEETFAQSAYKAVTIRKLAGLAAKKGELAHARELAALLTMSMDYYRSMANSDIALHAWRQGDLTVLDETLAEAEAIARSQDDGYFVAGALREVAQVTFRKGNREAADRVFEDARTGARRAKSSQEQARAMSRIATRMGDIEHTLHAAATIEESIELAEAEEREAMRNYSFYEIGGSAAMSGNFDVAREVITKLPDTPFGTARSLRAAAQRDLAWGLARHGRPEEALEVASGIRTERERVAALSRLARVLNDPDMQSLPRYL